MPTILRTSLVVCVALACLGALYLAHAAESAYVPAPVFCADGSSSLCPVLPSFIGTDQALAVFVGYQGLSNDVTSAAQDVQTPFDNMSWQMFVALNWLDGAGSGDPATALSGDGTVVWQTYSRPEDVFGGATDSCPNPDGLPRFDLIAKGDAQDEDLEGFLQATGQPLIDVNGNFALYERRLNSVEEHYIVGHGLDSLAGQQVFAKNGNKVALPPGDSSTPDGSVGAIELKASWRIVSDAEKDDYFHIQALLDVEGEFVADGDPLCATVTLGLTGLHIIQNNDTDGALLPQFIWASFEHQDNSPLADAACDPTDPNCYKTISTSSTEPNVCPATQASGTYSFFNTACSGVTSNVPPVLATGQNAFQWNRQPPYAGQYTTTQGGTTCGTQVTRCWQVYSLTDQLNADWRAKLSDVGSVFANYYLIGTNWGGNTEPDGTQLANGSVPVFMGNSTLETYIQASPTVGNCVNCHSNATLAYEDGDTTYGADFSFLLGLANAPCTDVNAGPIYSNDQAQTTCPGVCENYELDWNGQWKTTQPGVQSVCGCCIPGSSDGA